mmetsp:Transcript_28068/g.36778  ORF Transcript_28068/g.36778 Transcript_28068/m.36778 type:complete len:463 (-) Transcript_28068:253-1641(-)
MMKHIKNQPHSLVPKNWKRGEASFKDIGTVSPAYKALDIDSGRVFAVESVDLTALTPTTGTEDSNATAPQQQDPAEVRKNMRSALKALSRLHHRNLQRYLGSDWATGPQGSVHIFSELVLGQSIESLLDQLGAFPENVICQYMKQVLEGLGYLHRKGFAHGWISPKNVCVTQRGVLKLTNFWTSPRLASELRTYKVPAPSAPSLMGQWRNLQHWDTFCAGDLALQMALADSSVMPLENEEPENQEICPHRHEEMLDQLADVTGGLRDFVWCCGKPGERAPVSVSSLLKHPFVQQLSVSPSSATVNRKGVNSLPTAVQESDGDISIGPSPGLSPGEQQQRKRLADLPTPEINPGADPKYTAREVDASEESSDTEIDDQNLSKSSPSAKILTVQQEAFLKKLAKNNAKTTNKIEVRRRQNTCETLDTYYSDSEDDEEPNKHKQGFLIMQQRRKITEMISQLQKK